MADALAKISGTLQEMSGEELARQQGLPAAPPTPLGAQGIGASQDVSKMAGTPNQIRGMVQGTLKERLRTKDLMQESERNGARGRFTVESLQEKMNVLEGLGSLDGRIQTALQTKLLNKTKDIAIPNTVNKTTVMEHLSSLGITDEISINKALAALDNIRKDGASATDITAALAALKIDGAITDSTTSLAGKFDKFFTQAGGENLKTQIATVLKNFSEIKMKDLLETTAEFSNQYNNIEDVPEILGVKDEVFAEMTFGEVQAQLKAWKNRNFQDVDALRSVLDDPTYSMAEKDYARQRLAELGAIGVTSIEQKANNLEAQVAEGDTVIVGGQAVKVSELMSDPKLKGVIATALESDEELTKLSGIDKGLADWITRNKAALIPIRNELLAGAEGFAKTNKEFVDKFGDDAAVYSKLLDSIIPGWNKAKDVDWATWSAEVAKTAPTFAAVLNELPSAARSVKFKILESMPADKAKSFSTDHLSAIASAANGDVTQAKVLTDAWLASPTIEVAKLDFALPATDEVFNQATSERIQGDIIKELGYPYLRPTFESFVADMQRLAKGSPAERLQAEKMYRHLGDIAAQAKKRLSPDSVEKLKQETKARVAKEGWNTDVKSFDDTFAGIIEDFKNRGGDHLATRGAEQFSKIKSAMATLRLQVAEGSVTPEAAQEKAKELQGTMADELAAFMLDKNHRLKTPAAALDALQLIINSGLKDRLSPGAKKQLMSVFAGKGKDGIIGAIMAQSLFQPKQRIEELLARADRLQKEIESTI